MAVYQLLAGHYGPQNWWPIVRAGTAHYKPEFLRRRRSRTEILEIAIGAILTQNTNWNNVVRALSALKERKLLSIPALEQVATEELATCIRSSGYYRQKAKKIKLLVAFVQQQCGGDVSRLQELGRKKARAALLSVWGIGPESADSIALYAYDFTWFVVDAYSKRLFSRLNLAPQQRLDYAGLQALMQQNLPEDPLLYKEYHALIVQVGKEFCRPRPLCGQCVLRPLCAQNF